MKKIIGIVVLTMFISINFSFAQFSSCWSAPNPTTASQETIDAYNACIAAESTTNNNSSDTTTATSCSEYDNERKEQTNWACPEWYTIDGFSNWTNTFNCCNPNPVQEDTNNNWSPTSVMGIECDETKLIQGQCKLNIYDTLGIRKSVRDKGDPTSVGLFVQDIVLSATFFIGTLVTVALIVSGIMFIFAASSGKDPANAKKGIIGSLVGLLIVVSSYVIIRLVQYIAKGF